MPTKRKVRVPKTIKDVVTERMFQLMRLSVQVGKVRNQTDWCEKIGIAKQNITQIREGRASFTHEHVKAAADLVGASFDFIYGKIGTFRHNGVKI